MEIIIQETSQDAANAAASIIAKLLNDKPNAVLGLATGSTPLPLYQRLIELKLDWSQAITFNLDEYIGLPRDHAQTYHTFMWENLFKHTNINPANVYIPDGNASDIPKFCADYEALIKAKGGIDIQVLGIGSDGHIGFNEPTSSLASRTRIKTLTQQTIKDNARFFGSEEEIPHHVITMGIGTIMEARQNILLAFGENKAQAIAEAVEGPIQAINPATILQMHPNAKFFLDTKAASRLKRIEYYNWVYSNKPEWQRF
ncbi:MAG: glucosamine-6-phosphate deaminase [Verrucomicrobiota bacterium]